IDGSALSPEHEASLVEARVLQSVGSASRCELRFFDHDFRLIDGNVLTIGKSVTVGFDTPRAQTVQVFAGEIVAIGVEQAGETRHQLVVEAFDKSHRL
ncbi:MAG TPA: hypothetical protein PLV68_08520, partial [Ilumatobacteraceae bacterium]|nr:hypothetical protein [Ilumatobacteraceae bacterium]